MATPDQTIRTISSFLSSGATLPREELTRLADEYATLCREAQRRLAECGRLLALGQGSEAIYLAEAHPPLLDAIGQLDFAGAGAWIQFCSSSDLPAAEPFDTGVVKLLDEQYSRHASVEPLINRYRKLSVKQGPLQQRISILHRLAMADPENPSWRGDLEALEVSRFKEIAAVLQRPGSLTEANALAFVKELSADGMVNRPNPELVAQARRLHAELKRGRFEGYARRMAAQANDAYAAMDLQDLQACLRMIDDQAAEDQEPIPADVEKSLADARHWAADRLDQIRQEEAFESGCQMLEAKLEETAPYPEISRLLHQLQSHGKDLPEGLAERSRNEIHSQLVHERRRRTFKVVGIATAVVLLVAAVGLATWFVLDKQELSDIAQRIQQFTASGDFAGGRAYVKQITAVKPDRLTDGAVSGAIASLDAAQKAEDARVNDLTGLSSRLASLAADDTAFKPLLERAERIAVSADEKENVRLLKAEAQAKVVRRRKGVDDGLIELLSKVTAAYDVVRAATEATTIRTEAKNFDAALQRAEAVSGASSELRSQVGDYRARYNSELQRATDLDAGARRLAMQRVELRRQIADATKKLPDVGAYAALSEQLTKSHPGEADVPNFAAWSALVPYYLAVLQTSEAVEQSRRRVPAAPFRETAVVFKDFLEHLAPLQTDVPTPWTSTLELMKSRADGSTKFSAGSEELSKYLRNPLISSVMQFEIIWPTATNTSTQYYATDPKIDDRDGWIQYSYLDQEHRDLRLPSRKKGKLAKNPILAPHCSLAREVELLLKEERDKPQWTQNVSRILERCLAFSNANPEVQITILMKLIELNDAAGKPAAIDESMRRGVTQLDAQEVNFLAPSDAPNVSASLNDLAKRIDQDRQAWLASLRATSGSDGRMNAQVDALYRPLRIAGVVVREAGTVNTIRPIGSSLVREYWAIQLEDKEPHFVIAATVTPDGKITWAAGQQSLPVGLPLLTPVDGEDTIRRAGQFGLLGVKPPTTNPVTTNPARTQVAAPAGYQPARGWPVNLGLIQEK